jgi:hypothetical protein
VPGRLSLLLSLGLACSCAGDLRPSRAAEPDKVEPEVNLNDLRTGMPQAEVRRRLGPPKRFARQILYRRYLEQWVYEGPKPVRIEFDCVRGKEPQILTVQQLTAPAP